MSFSNSKSLKDVEMRVQNFCNYLLKNYDNKTVAIVAHKALQFAFEVITLGKTWKQAIEKDWRQKKK